MMIIKLKVIPQAKKNCIKQEGDLFKIHLTAKAIDGKANQALLEFLAQHFHVRPRQIEIIKGLKSREKTVRINDDFVRMNSKT